MRGGGQRFPTGGVQGKYEHDYEIDNQTTIRFKHYDINTHPQVTRVLLSYNYVSDPGPALWPLAGSRGKAPVGSPPER